MKSACGHDCGTAEWSPPSRGAWIEIEKDKLHIVPEKVAPLAGGVD